MHPQLPLSRPGALQADGIIKVFRVGRVYGDDRVRAAIHPPGPVRRRHFPPQRLRLRQNLPGEMQGQLVLADDRKHVHSRGVRRPQHLDDLARRPGLARRPLPQTHDNLIVDPRRAPGLARRRHVNLVADARVIRKHVEGLPVPPQRAD